MRQPLRRTLPIDRSPEWSTFAAAPGFGTTHGRIYAVGDIHGHAEILEQMLAAIERDFTDHPATSATIVFLGDLIDRGLQSAQVIDRLARLVASPLPGTSVACLRGNHEQWLLDFLSDAAVLAVWGVKGGSETLASYGVVPDASRIDMSDIAIAETVRQALLEVLPDAHRQFLASLQTSLIIDDYLFVHAGVDPDRALDDQLDFDLTWIRAKFLLSRSHFGKIVVHGHTRTAEVESLPNRINLDTGIYVQGILSCVILQGQDRHLLQVQGEPVAGHADLPRSHTILRPETSQHPANSGASK
jgi:serine/threonine protein phosphatase 1